MSGVQAAWAVGDELPPLLKELTLERLIAYGGPAKNLHSDLAAARAEGFPSVVAWGMLSVSFVSELLGSHFGLGWARGGRLSVSLVKPLFAGDTVAVRARVSGVEAEGDAVRYAFDIWCENGRGDRVLAGTASALAEA